PSATANISAPSCARRSATARPIPLDAPVTSATLPFRSAIVLSLDPHGEVSTQISVALRRPAAPLSRREKSRPTGRPRVSMEAPDGQRDPPLRRPGRPVFVGQDKPDGG